jgi:hypothetical protein
MQILPEAVRQESSAKVTALIKDAADGSAVTPTTVTWTLMALDGTVINGRQDVSASASSTVEIWLSGDDLQILDETNEYELRKILIKVTYDNGVSTIPLLDEGQFAVHNLAGVS